MKVADKRSPFSEVPLGGCFFWRDRHFLRVAAWRVSEKDPDVLWNAFEIEAGAPARFKDSEAVMYYPNARIELE